MEDKKTTVLMILFLTAFLLCGVVALVFGITGTIRAGHTGTIMNDQEKYSLLLFMGIWFTGISLLLLLSALKTILSISDDIFKIAAGFFFMVAGGSLLALMSGSWSVKENLEYIVSEFSIQLFIPIMFFVAGWGMLIQNLFFDNKKKNDEEDCT